jgi:tetrahydromethanopterin S-methyltransferase subunit G
MNEKAIDVLTRRVDEIEQKIENNRVVYLRPPKN